jgi:hypothetical protein
MATEKKKFSLSSVFFNEAPEAAAPAHATATKVNPKIPSVSDSGMIPSNSTIGNLTDIPISGTISAVSMNPQVGSPNQKTIEALCSLIEERNMPGPDFQELKNASNALAMMMPDETQRFKTAFITLQSTNPTFTKEVVLNSIDAYVGIIEEERKKGIAALAEKRKKEVEEPQRNMEYISKERADLLNQIEQLQTEIAKKSDALGKLQLKLQEAEATIDKQTKDFNASADFMVHQFQTDKAKLQNIL